MTNQWGRDSQPTSTRGSGAAGTGLVAVLCLLLGAGGGFGYFVLTRPNLKTEVEALDTRLREVGSQLTQANARLTETTAERDKLEKDIAAFRANAGSWAQDLEKELVQLKLEEVPKLNRLLETRDEQIDTLQRQWRASRTNHTEALAEMATLRAKLAEAQNTQQQEQADQNAMDKIRIADLTKKLVAANEKLSRPVTDGTDKLRIADLTDQLVVANQKLAQAEKGAGAATTDEAQDILRRQLDAAMVRLAASERQMSEGESAIARLNEELRVARLSGTNPSAETEAKSAQTVENEDVPKLNALLETQQKQIETLQRERRTARAERAEALAEVARLRVGSQNGLTAKQADDVRQEALEAGRKLDEALKAAAEKNETDARRISDLTYELTLANQKIAELAKADAAATAEETPQPANLPRDSAFVEQALSRTVGLQGLEGGDRVRLRDELTSGACVLPSLDLVFDRVPVLVLRNLMRDLKSDC